MDGGRTDCSRFDRSILVIEICRELGIDPLGLRNLLAK